MGITAYLGDRRLRDGEIDVFPVADFAAELGAGGCSVTVFQPGGRSSVYRTGSARAAGQSGANGGPVIDLLKK